MGILGDWIDNKPLPEEEPAMRAPIRITSPGGIEAEIFFDESEEDARMDDGTLACWLVKITDAGAQRFTSLAAATAFVAEDIVRQEF